MTRRRFATLVLSLGVFTAGATLLFRPVAAAKPHDEGYTRLDSGLLVVTEKSEGNFLVVGLCPHRANEAQTRATLEELLGRAIGHALHEKLDRSIRRLVSNSTVLLSGRPDQLDEVLVGISDLRETTEFPTAALVFFQDQLVQNLLETPSPGCVTASQLAAFSIPRLPPGCSIADPIGGSEIDAAEYQAIVSQSFDAGASWVIAGVTDPRGEAARQVTAVFEDWKHATYPSPKPPPKSTRHVWRPYVEESSVVVVVPLVPGSQEQWRSIARFLPRTTEDGINIDASLDPRVPSMVLAAASVVPPGTPAAELLDRRDLILEALRQLLLDAERGEASVRAPSTPSPASPEASTGEPAAPGRRRSPSVLDMLLEGVGASDIAKVAMWWDHRNAAPDDSRESDRESPTSTVERTLASAQTLFILKGEHGYPRPALGEEFGEEITGLATAKAWRGEYAAIRPAFLALAGEEPGRALALLDTPPLSSSPLTVVHFARASSLAALGRRRAALGACQAALLANADFAPALRLDSRLHLELGHAAAARKAAHAVLALDALDDEALKLAAGASVQLEEFDEAERLLRLRGEEMQPMLDLGAFLRDVRKQPTEAFEAFVRARLSDSYGRTPSMDVDMAFVRAVSELSDPERVVEIVEKSMDPSEHKEIRGLMWTQMGVLLARARERGTAEAFFVQASSLGSLGSEYQWVEIGRLLSDEGLFEDALDANERALALAPGRPGILRDIAWCKMRLGRPQEALEQLDELLTRTPKNGSLWRERGHAQLHGLKDPEAALRSYRRALEIDPEDYRTLDAVGFLHEREGHYEEALAAYEQSLTVNSENGRALVGMGRLLHEHFDRPAEAERAFRKAIEIHPASRGGWAGLGKLLSDQARLEEALPALERSIDLAPTSARYLAPLLESLETVGNKTALARATSAIIELAEKSTRPYDRAEIARTLATALSSPSQDELRRALSYAEEACTLTRRQDAYYLDTLAKVHFRLGDRGEALRVIDEALALPDADTESLKEQRARYAGEGELATPAD